MQIPIKRLVPQAVIPTYAHDTDAGLDLYASETVTIQPMQRALVPSGIALAIPKGYVGLIWDKSGLAVKHGLTAIAGVIDAGYRGDIQVAMYNTTQTAYVVEAGKKIAQLLIQPIVRAQLEETKELPDAARGDNGFGSTGL